MMLHTAHVIKPLLEFALTGVPLEALAAPPDRPVEAVNAPPLIAAHTEGEREKNTSVRHVDCEDDCSLAPVEEAHVHLPG